MTEIELNIEVDAGKTLSYTYLATGRPIVRSIEIRNLGPDSTAGVQIRPRVRIDAPFEDPVVGEWTGEPRDLPRPRAVLEDNEPLVWRSIRLPANPAVLGRLPEVVSAMIVVEVLAGDEGTVVAEKRVPLDLLAANAWVMDFTYPDALAAFVLPHSSAIKPILKDAREYLGRLTGDPSTSGYQTVPEDQDDPETWMGRSMDPEGWRRVDLVAEAIYEAIRARNIAYTDPGSSTWGSVQRIRSPREILVDGAAGTCLDTSVLYAACLAEAGLDPVLYLVEGHAFCGYAVHFRLCKTLRYRPPSVLEPIQILQARELVQAVETTTLCDGGENFRVACNWQDDPNRGNGGHLRDPKTENLQALVIVRSAWDVGIRPPPAIDVGIVDELEGDHPGTAVVVDGSDTASTPGELPEPAPVDIAGDEDRTVPQRVRQWQNSLLDLSASNQLLNMKSRGGASRLMEFELPGGILGSIDDKLFEDGERLTIQTPAVLPANWRYNGASMREFAEHVPSLQSPLVYPPFSVVNHVPKEIEGLIEFRDTDPEQVPEKRLPFWEALQGDTDADVEVHVHRSLEYNWQKNLDSRVKSIREKAETAMLETGTNAMYLTLGVLSWDETTSHRGGAKRRSWSAPMYMYPVLLEGGRGAPFTLRLDPTGSVTPNYCLREKLLREPTNLDLPELEFPDWDESGLDFDKMFGSIEARVALAKLDNVAVERRCVFGVFDYATFRLWKDLKDHWQEMRDTSPVVEHLMYTTLRPFDESLPDAGTELDPHCPHRFDDSQLEAIRWALAGRSFRLEGPPGTGKTQTITNLVASCLAHNKKVLFVAEKSTALQQVKERLHEVGLGDFCLELHAKGDTDTRLRATLSEQLKGAIGATADPRERKWEDLKFLVDSDEKMLDQYKDAIHTQNEACHRSLWEAHEELLEVGEGDVVEVPREFLEKYDDYWPIFRRVFTEFPHVAEVAGSLERNCWRFVDALEFRSIDRAELSSILERLGVTLSEFETLKEPWATLHAVANPPQLGLALICAELSEAGALPSAAELDLIGGATWEQIAEEITNEVDDIFNELTGTRDSLHPSVLVRSDTEDLVRLVEAVDSASFFSRGKHRKALETALGPDAATKDRKALHAAVRTALTVVPRVEDVRRRVAEELRVNMPSDWSPMAVDATEVFSSLLGQVRAIAEEVESAALREFMAHLTPGTPIDRLSAAIVQQVHDSWQRLGELLQWSNESITRWTGERSFLRAWADDQADWQADRGNRDTYLALGRWASVLEQAGRLTECGLSRFRHQVLSGSLPLDEFADRVTRGLLREVLEERSEAGEIDYFDGRKHNLRIANLERILEDMRDLMGERVPGLVSQRKKRLKVHPETPFGEAAALMTGLKSGHKKNRKPIRTLIDDYGETLSDVMPCFLMSPDSVATLLPVGSITFDIVIFDEASQIPTPNAIGALGRGRANIVVGDSEQMPPTNTFSSNRGRFIEDEMLEDVDEDIDGLEDGEDSLITDLLPVGMAAPDLESILQEFEAAQLPSIPLLCHYRSRDEVLIAFSNYEIYAENPMMTFPSVKGHSSEALKWCPVPDGQFMRKKTIELSQLDPDQQKAAERAEIALREHSNGKLLTTNPLEAEAVAEEVWARLTDPVRRKRREAGASDGAESMIVVTFNIPQKKLITALLLQKQDESDPVVSRAFEDRKDEDSGVLVERAQLKIMNLEYVQGDEAETVIFSVAFTKYGPGERKTGDTNEVPGNFGPVNKPGGYRRLNVAVTRAKSEMLVFCSFDPDDIAVKPTSPRDLRLVQSFLKLVKEGPRRNASIGIAVSRSHHVSDIARTIEEMGYRVETNVGLSKLRVDIAVGRLGGDTWEIAVMVDGPAWSERGSAYQREVLPGAMLTLLGWKQVIRVWLPSWIDERDDILDKIRNAMEGTEEEPPVEDPEVSDIGNGAVDRPDPDPEEDKGVAARGKAGRLGYGRHLPDDHDGSPVARGTKDDGAFSPFVVRPELVINNGREYLDVLAKPERFTRELIVRVRTVLEATIRTVLEAEAPIEANRLAKFVANTFGLENVHPSRIDLILKFVPENQITRTQFGAFVWLSPTQAESWSSYRHADLGTREYDQIAPQEYTNAILDVVEHGRSVLGEEAISLVAQQFGLGSQTKNGRFRVGKHAKNRIREILDQAIQTGLLSNDGDGRLRLPDRP